VIIIVHIHSFVPVRYVWEWKELRRYLKYSVPLIPNNLFAWVTNLSDRLVIAWYVGMAAVGVYSMTYLFGLLLSAIYIPISFALFPAIAEAWMHEDTETIKKYITYSIFYYLIVAVPAAVLMIATSPYLLHLLAGREFVTNPWLVTSIVVGLAMVGLYNIILYVIHLYERTIILTFIFALVALINFSGNLILVPNMGILGAGIMTLISYTTQLILIIFVSKYLSKKNLIIWPSVWKVFFSSVPLILLFYIPSHKTMGQMVCLVISSLTCYALLLLMFGAIGRKEWLFISKSLFRYNVSQ
jgi:O-antigen/teichoic acid export membrane protein